MLETILDRLKNPGEPERAKLLFELAQAGGPARERAVDAALRFLLDSDSSVRSSACYVIERLQPGIKVLPDLVLALRRGRELTCAELAAKRSLHGADPAVAFRPEIRRDQRTVMKAMDHIAKADGFWAALRPAVPDLLEIAADPLAEDPDLNEDTGSRAAYMLGGAGDASCVPALAAILDAEGAPYNGAVLEAVAYALGELGGPAAGAALERELARPRSRSWRSYTEALGAALEKTRRGR